MTLPNLLKLGILTKILLSQSISVDADRPVFISDATSGRLGELV